MTPEEKFKEMAMSAKDSIENFNDFFDDQAVAWAYNEITTLRAQRDELVEALNQFVRVNDEYITTYDCNNYKAHKLLTKIKESRK